MTESWRDLQSLTFGRHVYASHCAVGFVFSLSLSLSVFCIRA